MQTNNKIVPLIAFLVMVITAILYFVHVMTFDSTVVVLISDIIFLLTVERLLSNG